MLGLKMCVVQLGLVIITLIFAFLLGIYIKGIFYNISSYYSFYKHNKIVSELETNQVDAQGDNRVPNLVVHYPKEKEVVVYSNKIFVNVEYRFFDQNWIAGASVNGRDVSSSVLSNNGSNGFVFMDYLEIENGINQLSFWFKNIDDPNRSVKETIHVNRLEPSRYLETKLYDQFQQLDLKYFYTELLNGNVNDLEPKLSSEEVAYVMEGTHWDDFYSPDIKVYELGSVNIENNTYKMLKLEYGFNTYDARKKMLIGYLENSVINYFPNAVYDIESSVIFNNFIRKSDFLIDDVILDTPYIKLLETGDSLIFSNLCETQTSLNNKSKLIKDIIIDDLYRGYDKYGNCVNYVYQAGYYLSEIYLDQKTEFEIDYFSGETNSKTYNIYQYRCGYGGYVKFLDENSVDTLDYIGDTANGFEVYSPSVRTPYLDIQIQDPDTNVFRIIPDTKWKDYLINSSKEYPILIIKDLFGNYRIYVASSHALEWDC